MNQSEKIIDADIRCMSLNQALFMLKWQEAGWSSLLVPVMRPKVDGAGTDSFWPHYAYGQRQNPKKTSNATKVSNGFNDVTAENDCFSLEFLISIAW